MSPIRKTFLWLAGLTAAGLVACCIALAVSGAADEFMPHATCYMQNVRLIWLHVVSDVLIGAAYVAISATLACMVARARRELPFHWMMLAFAVFIIACGSTHFIEAWTVWSPHYWIAGNVKMITAIASVATAVLLPPLVPKVTALLEAAKLGRERKEQLEIEVEQRRRAEAELKQMQEQLEQRVRDRTSQLSQANSALELFETLFQNAAWGVAIIDAKRELVQLANPAFAQMHGYDVDKIIGMPVARLVAPEFREQLPEVAAIVAKTGHHIYEVDHVRADGTRFLCMADATAAKDPEGLPLFRFTYFQDVSRRAHAESVRAQTETELQSTFENAAVGMAHLDLEGRWLRVNARLAGMIGYPADELLQKSFQDITHPDDLAADLENARKLLAGEIENYSMEKRYVRKNGELLWINLTASLMRDAQGAPRYFIAVIEDIDARKRAEKELREVTARARCILWHAEVREVENWEEAVRQGGRRLAWDLRLHDERGAAQLVDLDAPPGKYFSEWIKHISPETQRAMDAVSEKAMLEGRDGYEQEFSCTDANGEIHWLHEDVSLQPMGNHTWRAVGVITDLTARKRAEAELRTSALLLRELADAMPQIVWAARPDGQFDYYNRRWTEYTGMTLEDTANRGWQPVLHPEDRQRSSDRWAASVSTGEPYEIEYRLRRARDGAYRWHLGRALPVRDSSGEAIIRWFGTCTDIHDYKTTLEELQQTRDTLELRVRERTLELEESRQRLQLIADNLPVLVSYVDHEERYRFVNKTYEQWFGKSPAEIHGATMREVLGEAGYEPVREQVRAALAGKEVKFDREHTENGVHRFVEVHYIPAASVGSEKASGFYVLVLDLTERKRAEDEIRKRTAELAAANRELEMLSYSISHDLRAPLRAIEGFSRALDEDYGQRLDETGRDFIRRICEATQRMGRLINDLLTLARVTRKEMIFEVVDLSGMARQIAEELGLQAPERSVEWVIAPGLRAQGDPALLRNALENLLGNAWKFTAKQPRARIEFSADAALPGRFVVRDNGAGFDMALREKLFGVFQRLHTAEEFPGTGVGLASVQRIIRKHGGEVTADGKPGEGAVFAFTLPAGRQ